MTSRRSSRPSSRRGSRPSSCGRVRASGTRSGPTRRGRGRPREDHTTRTRGPTLRRASREPRPADQLTEADHPRQASRPEHQHRPTRPEGSEHDCNPSGAARARPAAGGARTSSRGCQRQPPSVYTRFQAPPRGFQPPPAPGYAPNGGRHRRPILPALHERCSPALRAGLALRALLPGGGSRVWRCGLLAVRSVLVAARSAGRVPGGSGGAVGLPVESGECRDTLAGPTSWALPGTPPGTPHGSSRPPVEDVLDAVVATTIGDPSMLDDPTLRVAIFLGDVVL